MVRGQKERQDKGVSGPGVNGARQQSHGVTTLALGRVRISCRTCSGEHRAWVLNRSRRLSRGEERGACVKPALSEAWSRKRLDLGGCGGGGSQRGGFLERASHSQAIKSSRGSAPANESSSGSKHPQARLGEIWACGWTGQRVQV